ncbi:MAG: hypothetical protein ACK501_06870 [Planctomycetota bacterium]|jgi:hypothetical protein
MRPLARRDRPRRWFAPAALLLLATSGCSYLRARVDDLGDCFLYRLNQHAIGIAAVAKVGPAEVAVGGWFSEYGWGKDTWWQRPGYVLTNHGVGVPFTTLGPLGYGQSWARFLCTSSAGNHPGDPRSFDDARAWLGLSDVFDLDDQAPFRLTTAQKVSDLFGVEVGAAPLLWNVHLGVNVAEFADFLLGFVLVDVFFDDGRVRPPTIPVLPGDG